MAKSRGNPANLGPNLAYATSLTVILPLSATLLSVEASYGSCSGTGILICDLGSVITDTTAVITVTVVPTGEGWLETSVEVRSTSREVDEWNNVDTLWLWISLPPPVEVRYDVYLPLIRR